MKLDFGDGLTARLMDGNVVHIGLDQEFIQNNPLFKGEKGDKGDKGDQGIPGIRELSLSRFRIDRIDGDDNDRHKIERVRVNDRDEEIQKKNGGKMTRYRDAYGNLLQKSIDAAAIC